MPSARSRPSNRGVHAVSAWCSTALTSIATSTTTRATTATSTRATTVRPRAPRSVRSRADAWLLVLLLAWTTFAFAGVYLPSLIGPALVCVALVVRDPPRLFRDTPALDAALLTAVAASALQLVPLPAALLGRVSPE